MSNGIPDDEGYFNDLSRQPSSIRPKSDRLRETAVETANAEEPEVPKTKRVACVICRKRKLRCDGARPKCGTCARLGHNCTYDELRRKSGPKRGYVKELEARLAQVETQLKSNAKEETAPSKNEANQPQNQTEDQAVQSPPLENTFTSDLGERNSIPGAGVPRPVPDLFDTMSVPNQSSMPGFSNVTFDDDMAWEMIGLGLEEPLPTQQAIDELHELYFTKCHPTTPIIHPYRYKAAMDLAPHMRPPVCLRYAIWCLAASVSEKYFNHQEIFYRRARRYAESDEMKGLGEAFVSVAHSQCWTLIATYEFKMMFFPRAWASVGRTIRLAQMMGLHRLDGTGLDVKQVLPPPKDWTDREERRRTFWMAYCVDRYASMGTGWPLAIDERDILTNMPASEENFERCIPQETPPLSSVFNSNSHGATSLSAFAGVIFVTHLFGRNLSHLHRPTGNEAEENLQGEFWKRHRLLDNLLLNTSLSLPPHLRLPAGVREANTVFLNMSLHTSTICLHQAAIFKAEKNNLPASLIDQSHNRCLLAATEITTVMRLISHLDSHGMNPFLAFCLYVAARVFLNILKKKPDDYDVRSSLEFLLVAMYQLKRTSPLSESFLIQLGLDLQGTGLDTMLHNPDQSTTFAKLKQMKQFETHGTCSPVMDIRDSPKHMHPIFDNSTKMPKSPFDVPQIITASESEPQKPPNTQYSMSSFEIPTRNSPRPAEWQFITPKVPEQLDKVASGLGWGTNVPAGSMGVGGFVDSYDTDMSGAQSSSGPSPESSHTSHSPHSQPENLKPANLQSSAYTAARPTPGAHDSFNFMKTSSMDAVNGQYRPGMASDSQQQQQSKPMFWNYETTGATPAMSSGMSPGVTTGLTSGPTTAMTPSAEGQTFVGMTPSADGDWSAMIEGMSWDSTVLGASPGPWPSSSGPSN